ncbi:hypothetical protein ACJMK2_000964 [Sinanodonta woodiana]|uniref:TIR domain-containing protein n=1 Tax=Sinanodonta woodiana TaxID=1069815 RepID=A0ABD3XQU8_SINWO
METRLVFLLGCIASFLIGIYGANVTCTVNYISYICKHIANTADFPIVLPANIRKVTLFGTNQLDRSFPNGLFRNPSWLNVSELSILEFSSIDFIEEEFLAGLDNLKFLTISSCPELKKIQPDVFQSTPDLEALYLDGNHYLKLPVVEQALNGTLDKLKYLSLTGIEVIGRHVVLGEKFARVLFTKHLTYIEISGVKTIIIEHVDVLKLLSNVKYLNISYSTLLVADSIGRPVNEYFRNIEYLDATSTTSFGQYNLHLDDSNISWVLGENIKYVFAQHITDPNVRLRLNANYNFENGGLQGLKVLDLSRNNIMFLNITFSGTNDFSALETLNLSSNHLEYISPSLLSSFPSLKLLDLSRNQLHLMQNMDDFLYLFSRNKDLEIIYLPKNNLSVVPSDLFSSNTKLRVIDLIDNELTCLNIDLHHILELSLVDLRNNRLRSLPVAFLEQLEQIRFHQDTAEKHETSMTHILLNDIQDKILIAEKYKYGYNASDNIVFKKVMDIVPQNLLLNVLENPFVCDCDSLDSMKWIVSTYIGIVNRTRLTCKYNNNAELLNNAVIETVRDNCRLLHLTGIAIVSSVATMVSILALGITIHLRRKTVRQSQDLHVLRREILDDNIQFKFVVFLSFCSKDSHVVENIIQPLLNTFLQETFNTDKNLVCTGADSFVPGMLIIEEIHRCINESLVIVPVITPAFLESRWSLRECVDAIEGHKQVVVLMEQNTDTSETIETIRHLIGQYTRASWSYSDGQFVIHPSWNIICDGIIRTAIDSIRNRQWN